MNLPKDYNSAKLICGNMRILVDGRCFQTPHATGVSAYASSVLQKVFAENTEHEYVVWYNGVQTDMLPQWNYPHVSTVVTHWPNKMLHASLVIFRWPYIDRLVARMVGGSFDQFLSLNLHAVSLSPTVEHVVTVHDLSFEHLPECYTFWQQIRHALLRPNQQCQRATMIQTPSAYTKDDVVATYDIAPEKIVVVPPTVSKCEDAVLPADVPPSYVLCIGTVEPRKNIQTLIDAFVCSKIYETHQISLVIVGSQGWKTRGLRKYIKHVPGVLYRGYVNEAEKWGLYRNAKACVYPSLYEGFGLPVAEALSVGTPVITSNRTSLLELYDPTLVTFVNPDNVAELTVALQYVGTQSK
jgi:glycosyltransferase involved in cell wall biosynthesis